ncbi:sugar ABC transporter ATP-binding protein [Pseudoclavibacter terrae]|uniref:sugar ABC transporter ATP-binding protein n=1 Tax=Pseudoclavibacter terrae TaxID=1530195 RepID=UPI00232D48C2|nr:sugar ABC transporter ATP-binding protein [Pseudoclavibacter terrae]
MPEIFLRAAALAKSFGGIPALKDGSITLTRGSITGLVGENGAGKSTLLSILSGNLRPDSGSLEVEGAPVTRFTPSALLGQHRVALVPQEIDLALDRTVAQNVMLGREGAVIPRSALLRRETAALCRRVGLAINPSGSTRSLAAAEQQLLLVARALGCNSQIMLFDEPTANLTPPEADRLHSLMHDLASTGVAIVYVSHHLRDVLEHCDQVYVLRDGAVRSSHDSNVSEDTLVAEMIGRERTPHRRGAPRATSASTVDFDRWQGKGFGPITTSVSGGSIVGLAGLPASGRSELLRSVMTPKGTTGSITVADTKLVLGSPKSALLSGVGYVPPERRSEGVFLDLTVSDNIASLNVAPRIRGFVDSRAARLRRAKPAHASAGITGRLEQPVRELSGGNQQKAVLARALTAKLRLLMLDEPTRGVDIEAKRAIHARVQQLADTGCTVLVSSSDVPELLELCDRILVMRNGQIVADLDALQADEEAVLEPALRTSATLPEISEVT